MEPERCNNRGCYNSRGQAPPSRQSHNLDTFDNYSSHPHPYYLRIALLAFLLILAMAIANAVASGFESMHAAKQKLEQKEPSLDYHSQGVLKSSDANRNAYADDVEAKIPEEEGATATVLSRASQLSQLISHLDASDVVECYVVTRMAPLASLAGFGVGTSSGGTGNGKVRTMLDDNMELSDANAAASKNLEDNIPILPPVATPSIPSGPVMIRKSALAFRYRPRVATASHSQEALSSNQRTHDKYFELTLEYGPQRAGATRTSESIPIVRMDTDSFGEDSNIGKYVSWENEGRVYHSTQISKDWTDAYYMAPISGVVFEKIIQRAVEYTSKRPRYQPFDVVSIPSGNLILRSSGSDDFVWDMFHNLAELYVVIDPLLVPPRDKVQFYVSDPDRTGSSDDRHGRNGMERDGSGANDKQVNPNVQKVKGPTEGSRAAVFYEKFFNCVHAIKTGDYSSYVPLPSFAPTLPPTRSLAPSMASNDDDVENKHAIDFDAEDIEDTTTGISDEYMAGVQNTTDDMVENNEGRLLSVKFLRYHRLLEETESDTIGEDAETNIEDVNGNPLSMLGGGELLIDSFEPIDNTYDPLENYSNQSAEVAVVEDDANTNAVNEGDSTEDSNEAAEKAAIEAAKAAENAAAIVATNTSSAADTAAATNEAAKAAQKAKDASVAARSKASAEALLSGDGVLMTSVLSSCFSDPKYGIRIKEDTHRVVDNNLDDDVSKERGSNEEFVRGVEMQEKTIAYLYFDGDVFFRLNLTAPYLGTARGLETVPPPHAHPEGHGDAVDWAIFLLILMGTLFGLLVMVHQAGIVVDKRLRFRHFFNPTKKISDWEYEGLNGENSPLSKGGGFPHSDLFLTVESIPTSMGGEDGSTSPTALHCGKSESTTSYLNDEHDLEMTERKFSALNIDDCPTTPTNLSSDSLSHVLPLSLRMKKFTPDLVERPSSKSYTKVAMPKQSPVSSTDCREVKLNIGMSPPPMT